METVREEINDLSQPPALAEPDTMVAPISSSGAARAGVGRVQKDLLRYGPGRSIPPMSLDEAFAYCRDLATHHYENFSVLSAWVPARVRPHFSSVYAYCRWSDDLADEMGCSARAQEMLSWWRHELDACFQGEATHPVFVALRQTIGEYGLDPKPFTDLLSAFVQDQSQVRYESDSELLDYCSRSANPVGRLVLKLAHSSDSTSIAWSDSICTGLQLVNFCQDIPVDARRGRIYWPELRWSNIGVSSSQLALSTASPEGCQGVLDWAEEARKYLIGGLPLVKRGPLWFARSVQLFVRGGLGLIRELHRNHGDVWSRSVTVSKRQKLQWIVRALFFPRSIALARIDQPRTDA